MTVRFDQADHFDLTCKPGVTRVQSFILGRWGRVGAIDSGCVSRNSNDGGGISEHNEGRAGDTGIRPIGNPIGDEIVAWLYANREGIGCQAIIYNGRVYSADRGDGWRPYTANRHVDHIHWELNWSGARAETSWFRGAPNAMPTSITPKKKVSRLVLLVKANNANPAVYITDGQWKRHIQDTDELNVWRYILGGLGLPTNVGQIPQAHLDRIPDSTR